ncbi:hypothetical protein P3B99_009430 [Opitutia bacterium KCR 482]|nr:hypothetical protein [Opitutae bacterium KCR 482]
MSRAPRRLAASGVRGYSADEFVRASELPEPCVFETELFYIAEYFTNVESYKIISDTLNRGEYESFSSEASWKRFFEMYNSAASENRNAAVEIGTQKRASKRRLFFVARAVYRSELPLPSRRNRQSPFFILSVSVREFPSLFPLRAL